MSNYEKQNFTSGQILKAGHLNYMEDGIEQLSERHYITSVTFEDNRTLGVTEPLYSHDASSLVALFRNTTKSFPIICREVWRMGNSEKALRLQMRSYALWSADGGYKVRMHFGEEYPDIIANSADNTYVYDPDWVAPAEVALKSELNTLSETVNGMNRFVTFVRNGNNIYTGSHKFNEIEQIIMNDCAKTTIALNITGMTNDGQMSVETCRAHSMTGVMNMSTMTVSYMLFSFIQQDGTIIKFKFNPDNTFTDVSFTTPTT